MVSSIVIEALGLGCRVGIIRFIAQGLGLSAYSGRLPEPGVHVEAPGAVAGLARKGLGFRI